MKVTHIRTAYATAQIMDNEEREAYERGYEDGYNECRRLVKQKRAAARERAERERRIFIYYLKKKLYGLVLAVVGVVSVFIEWDTTTALLIVPLGIYLMFTKEKSDIRIERRRAYEEQHKRRELRRI